ncbi:uncharacterized protein BDZ83DRAFT_631869 [Colletotrichum acutatum]|uniref:Uncharacterized protein n=1 Tax=Glomerella acutata TaxID=27357 RepID=A0AAD8UH19_GLOAC|nr:uncharacterized protein BDZ83DRAFT_631869 [Colletotrichum acutatum]KAK1719430.1 hypothetical protein BDZ83DRAFT_631869 [Colletotrichum acutatum]
MTHNTTQGRYDEKLIIERDMLGSFIAHGFEKKTQKEKQWSSRMFYDAVLDHKSSRKVP